MRAASAADSEITWLGVRPSVFVAMGDDESARFGGFFKLAVVVSVAATAILHAIDVVEVMHHFVKERCDYVLDRSCKRSGANVDFVRAAKLRHPSIFVQREVSVRLWRALNGDRRSLKCIFKILCIQKIENFVEITGYAVVTCEFLHNTFSPYSIDFWERACYNNHAL